MNLGERLKKAREAKGMTQEELGHKVNVSGATINRYEENKRKPDPDMLWRLAEILGTKTDYLLGEKEVPQFIIPNQPDMVDLPILGIIRAGGPLDRIEMFEGTYPAQKEKVKGFEAYWLRVNGESMAGGEIHDGDMVLVIKTTEVTSSDIAVVAVNHEEAILKRVKFQDDICILIPSNKEMETTVYPANRVFVLGKVVGFQRYW